MSENKTHYRKVFKSDHLGVADLEDLQESGSNLVFTIKHVKQEFDVRVAGKKINANIAYFNEPIKPLVLNATNSKVVKEFNGKSPFVEDWSNTIIQLYIDSNVKLMNEVVGGVRINPKQPATTKRIITPEKSNMWKNAKDAFKRDGNLVAVLEKAEMSKDHQFMLVEECHKEGLEASQSA